MNKEIKEFIENYLDSEFLLWKFLHSHNDVVKCDKAITDFESRYFSADVYSSISRAGNLTDVDFQEYSTLIATKRKRRIFCIVESIEYGYSAVLGSDYVGHDDKFELIVIEKSDIMRISSQYYTNFDGTFSYSGGKYLGEFISDPCPQIK